MHVYIYETGTNDTIIIENNGNNGNATLRREQIALNDFTAFNGNITLAEPPLPVHCRAFKQAVQSGDPPCQAIRTPYIQL